MPTSDKHTAHTLFSDDQIRFEFDNGIAHGLDLFLFDLQDPVPIFFFANLYVGLAFAFFVLERTVQEHDARVLYSPPHLGVCDVLIQHDAVQHLTVFNLAAGNLLDAGVALDVYLLLSTAYIHGHCPHSLERQVAHEF